MNEKVMQKLGETSHVLLLLIFLIIPFPRFCIADEQQISPPTLIAHAGGAINQHTYTNSLEALTTNYNKGFRFFEVDFSWTSDEELVAIHDWEGAFKGKFVVPKDVTVPTEAQFLKLTMQSGLTQLSLEQVLLWVKGKGDAFVVTDVKDDNTRALRKISMQYKKFQKYVIPQVYSYREYEEVSALGYSNIILTLYRMKIDPYAVIAFTRSHNPFAVTMHWKIAQSGLAHYLRQNNTIVYAHTVNDVELFTNLRKIGVFGIYTDSISP